MDTMDTIIMVVIIKLIVEKGGTKHLVAQYQLFILQEEQMEQRGNLVMGEEEDNPVLLLLVLAVAVDGTERQDPVVPAPAHLLAAAALPLFLGIRGATE